MVDGDFVSIEPTIAVFYSSSIRRIPNRGRYIVPILLVKAPTIIYLVTCDSLSNECEKILDG